MMEQHLLKVPVHSNSFRGLENNSRIQERKVNSPEAEIETA